MREAIENFNNKTGFTIALIMITNFSKWILLQYLGMVRNPDTQNPDRPKSRQVQNPDRYEIPKNCPVLISLMLPGIKFRDFFGV